VALAASIERHEYFDILVSSSWCAEDARMIGLLKDPSRVSFIAPVAQRVHDESLKWWGSYAASASQSSSRVRKIVQRSQSIHPREGLANAACAVTIAWLRGKS
jgi:hypothetical protein